jgi:hypothetical protein
MRPVVPVLVAVPTLVHCGKISASKAAWREASGIPSLLAPFTDEETGTESTDDLPVVTELPQGRVRQRTYCSQCPSLCTSLGTLEMGIVTRRQDLERGGKASFLPPPHSLSHTERERERERERESRIKAENLAEKKNPTPAPSKLILGQEVIAKAPNKKPTTSYKRLQVFN